MTALNGVYYSTSTGNVETIAGYIAKAVGSRDAKEIGNASDDTITGADSMIVGAPIWHIDAESERQEPHGTNGFMRLFQTLTWTVRRCQLSDMETKNHMVPITVIPPVSSMINLKQREPLFSE